MKPARFDYHAPQSLDEAISLLSQHGDDAKVLAGGQSLMPLMAMRLARPPVVVDINRISALEHVTTTGRWRAQHWGTHTAAGRRALGRCEPAVPYAFGHGATHRPLPDQKPGDSRRQHRPRRPFRRVARLRHRLRRTDRAAEQCRQAARWLRETSSSPTSPRQWSQVRWLPRCACPAAAMVGAGASRRSAVATATSP